MFNLKTAQNKQILEEKYLVPQEFSIELEQLLKNINNRGLTKFILNKIRQTPIQSQNQLEEIKKIIQQSNEKPKEQIKTIDPIDEKINQITIIPSYRIWVKKLFNEKKIQEEDFLKIKSLLETFSKLVNKKTIPEDKKDINLYNDDSKLNEYLNTFSQKSETNLENIKSGYKILDQNDKVKLLEVTEEETLKQICDVGYNINWCVIHGSWNDYSPPRYYCFVINGKPEVLVHPESGQIKDINDHPLQNGYFINLIDPFIKKFNLNTDNGDFAIYNEKVIKIEDFKKNINNEQFIEKELFSDPMNITLLNKDYWKKYIKIIIENLNKINYELAPLDLLNYLSDYCIINKLNDKFIYLEDKMIELLRKGDNFTRYNKIIPEKLKTKNLSNEYKMISEEISKNIEEYGYCPDFVYDWCKNQLKTNSEESKKWISGISKFIEKNGYCPNFAYDWCKNQLNTNSEESKIIISGISKFIEEYGYCPYFAKTWYKKEQEKKKLQQVQAKSSNWYKFYRYNNIN